ncbi:hypothetical protein KSP40_PGU012008 [Platanthera guangdongensis]|uniref:Uncharacterized protein n=1 Tax=Platanthera guangdongensis TaxID=2320717 RepID=A0ABR2N063_9ASPA
MYRSMINSHSQLKGSQLSKSQLKPKKFQYYEHVSLDEDWISSLSIGVHTNQAMNKGDGTHIKEQSKEKIIHHMMTASKHELQWRDLMTRDPKDCEETGSDRSSSVDYDHACSSRQELPLFTTSLMHAPHSSKEYAVQDSTTEINLELTISSKAYAVLEF